MRGKKRIIFLIMVSLAAIQFWHAFYLQPKRIKAEEVKMEKNVAGGDALNAFNPVSFFIMRVRAMWVDEQVFALLLFALALSWYVLEKRESKFQKDDPNSN